MELSDPDKVAVRTFFEGGAPDSSFAAELVEAVVAKMPFAEQARRIPVLLEEFGQRDVFGDQNGGSALGVDHTEPHSMATGHQCGACWRPLGRAHRTWRM